MASYEHHVFVCESCCAADEDALTEVMRAFLEALRAHQMLPRVLVNRTDCLEICGAPATVVVYPDGVWYEGVGAEDALEIVERHLVGGDPVERLRVAE